MGSSSGMNNREINNKEINNKEMNNGDIIRLCGQFQLEGRVVSCRVFGNGHINDTYQVCCEGDSQKRYVLQRMNTGIFHSPGKVMENVEKVTQWLREKVRREGGDPQREVLEIIYTTDGQRGYAEDGRYWRMYRFIEDALAYEQAPDEAIFRESAVAFGRFQYMLSDFPAHLLYETIPHFHDTPRRLEAFQASVGEGIAGRLEKAAGETEYLLEHTDLAPMLQTRLESGLLPLRVTHNDTKLNNVMIDSRTKKAVCVIDLDTVMPGLSATDFGDSIRFGASTAREDEPDPDKVHFDIAKYTSYAAGFLDGCHGALTDEEIRMLPWGAAVITYEQALRFLGDYLTGDKYYKTDYPEHNLVRARTQIRLLEEMLRQTEQMEEIVLKAAGRD